MTDDFDFDFDNSNLTSDTNVELDKSKHKPSGNQVAYLFMGTSPTRRGCSQCAALGPMKVWGLMNMKV